MSSCSLAILSAQRFKESTAREILSSFWLIKAKSFISSGRPFFADPAFLNKAKEGRADEIRRCLRCGRCYPGPSGEHETEK